jgi:myo-inositol-1(or 4)-monophosphatase
MVQEAGGRLGDFAGGASHMRTGNIIAAGPKVFRALTPVVKQHLGHLI